MSSASLRMAGMTDPGRVRDNNEDAFVTVPELGLAVLADGMGGHLAGEVASGIAVDIIRRNLIGAFADAPKDYLDPVTGVSLETVSLKEAVELANSAIYEAAHHRPECAGMGSTVVVAFFHANKVSIAHVGDSRLYRLRNGELAQITEDHSMIQELVRRGFMTPEEARHSANKNVVTRALGAESGVQVDVSEDTFKDGDVYLLCSDGLTDVLTDAQIAAILARFGDDLDTAVAHLIASANTGGGPDNISAILIRTGSRFSRNKKAVKQLQRLNN